MSRVVFNPDFLAIAQAAATRAGALKAQRTAQQIVENIEKSDRIDTGLMRDSTYSEQIGELAWQVGVRGPDYTKYQEFGTRPREGNRGIIGAHFVEDAKHSLEAGEISGLD